MHISAWTFRPGLLALAASLAWLIPVLFGATAAAASWEMRVCGYPDSLPFSDSQEGGFENRIAVIIAEELDAELSYVWWPQDATMLRDQLGEGHCDLLLGVPAGFEELPTTVAYYQSPYVFVYRSDSGVSVQSLDDAELAELRIGLQSYGIPPHDALLNRGLADRIVLIPPMTDDDGTVIEAVGRGDVDLAIAWGPVAAYHAGRSGVELEIVPVSPEVDIPFISMVLPMTMGVRRGDEIFRDTLNRAISQRWDEIQAVLADYGVPVVQQGRPSASGYDPEIVRVGVVVPSRSGIHTVEAAMYEVVGEAARQGALLAESDRNAYVGADGPLLVVLPASAPSAEAASRAAARLVSTEGVDALVGGINDEQAWLLAELADVAGIPFFNIGSTDPDLRDPDCRPLVFNVEASAAMYLQAMVAQPSAIGLERWFIVHEASELGAMLHDEAVRVLDASSGVFIVGSAVVQSEQPTYAAELEAAAEAGADVILLLTGPRDHIPFLAQHRSHGGAIPVLTFPHQVTQTRDFLATLRSVVGAAGHQLALWDATVEADGAGDLNRRFGSRWGVPMEPTAWAAYAAVSLAHHLSSAKGDVVVAFGAEAASLDLFEGPGIAIDDRNQLVQPLYVVDVDMEAPYGVTLSQLLALAKVVGTIPAEDVADPSVAGIGCG